MSVDNRWPDASVYASAARDPSSFFADRRYQQAELRRSPLGIPLPATGRNAVVFKASLPGTEIAIRCFTNPPDEGQVRYLHINQHLADVPLENIPASSWNDDAVLAADMVWPMITMAWVEGLPLDQYIGRHVDDRATIEALAEAWEQLMHELDERTIAHGDLQHGNVLVDDRGHIHLVDLDGVWVPALSAHPAREYGHPNYQHPQRTERRPWNSRLDGFSALLIQTSLRAVAADPALWSRYNDGANNLLFTAEDLDSTSSGDIWADLARSPDPEVVRLATRLKASCGTEIDLLGGPVQLLGTDGIERSERPRWLHTEIARRTGEFAAVAPSDDAGPAVEPGIDPDGPEIEVYQLDGAVDPATEPDGSTASGPPAWLVVLALLVVALIAMGVVIALAG